MSQNILKIVSSIGIDKINIWHKLQNKKIATWEIEWISNVVKIWTSNYVRKQFKTSRNIFKILSCIEKMLI